MTETSLRLSRPVSFITSNWRTIAIALLSLSILGWQVAQFWFVVDDAFIAFRFAVNAANGHGLVFNIGERVEGYTSFLWTAIMAVVVIFGGRPEIWANVLAVVATATLLVMLLQTTSLVQDERDRELPAIVTILFLVFNRSFAVWATGGLETRLFTLLLFLSLTTFHLGSRNTRRLAISSALFGLASLTRMEAVLFFGLCSGWLLWDVYHRSELPRSIQAWSVPFLTMVGGHTLFRLAYYGYPLPNTFYAKVNQPNVIAGLHYLYVFALEYQLWLIAPLLVLGLIRSGRLQQPLIRISLSFIPYLGYLVYVGGDHFEFRQLDILWPFLALILARGTVVLDSLKHWAVRSTAIVLAVLAIVSSSAAVPWVSGEAIPSWRPAGRPTPPTSHRLDLMSGLPAFRSYFQHYWFQYHKMTYRLCGIRAEEHREFYDLCKGQADLMNRYLDEGPLDRNMSLALTSVGVIPYFTSLTTIDCHGLTDVHVAHQELVPTTTGLRLLAHEKRADWSYIESRRVDIVFAHPWFFFTLQPPTEVLPGTYVIKLRDHFFAFRTTWTRQDVLDRFKDYPIHYNTVERKVVRLN